MSIVSNNYGVGRDTLGIPDRTRWHTDNSIQVKYYDDPQRTPRQGRLQLHLRRRLRKRRRRKLFRQLRRHGPKQSFLGAMVYNRFWFDHDRFGVTLGGGAINNPGRYLVLLPPINGATAAIRHAILH